LQVGFLLMKHIFDPAFGPRLPQILGLLGELVQHESGLEMLRTLLIYIAEANTSVTEEEFERGVKAAASPQGEGSMPTFGYVELAPNERGWLWLEPAQVWIGLEDNRVLCYNAEGRPFEHYPTVMEARVVAEKRARSSRDARRTG
jgi:hypothetical protein